MEKKKPFVEKRVKTLERKHRNYERKETTLKIVFQKPGDQFDVMVGKKTKKKGRNRPPGELAIKKRRGRVRRKKKLKNPAKKPATPRKDDETEGGGGWKRDVSTRRRTKRGWGKKKTDYCSQRGGSLRSRSHAESLSAGKKKEGKGGIGEGGAETRKMG